MQCPQCQHENLEGAKFCEECSSRLVHTCPNCEHEVRPQAKFCDACGTSLTASKLAPTRNQPEQPSADQEREPASYTPQHLAEKILTSRSALEGERKQVTVLFADVVGFTTEQMATAVEDDTLRSTFLQSALVQEILERTGRLDS